MYKINDIVYIKNSDRILYRIKEINQDNIILTGFDTRNIIKVKKEDILLAKEEQIIKEVKKNENLHKKIVSTNKTRYKQKVLYGRVLHIDSDSEFLTSCLKLYKDLDIYAYGVNLGEKEIYKEIKKIYLEITPEVIVITGHDQYNGQGIKDINNYENSPFFIKAIRVIRSLNTEVIIIAGACASNFEALIASGANFASSPERVNTHTYDPAIVAIKASTTPIDRKIDFLSIIKYIEGGRSAIGGVETMGTMRLIL